MRAQITHFGITADPDPYGVADDGAVWVPMLYSADGALGCTEIGAGQIGRVDPDGGVDGCWFTEWAVNRVGPHRLVG